MSDEKKENNGITIRLEPEIRTKLEALAQQEERSLAHQTAYLFKKYCLPHLDSLLGLTPPPSISP